MATNPFDAKQKQRLMAAKKRLMRMLLVRDACKKIGINTAAADAAGVEISRTLDNALLEFANINPDDIALD